MVYIYVYDYIQIKKFQSNTFFLIWEWQGLNVLNTFKDLCHEP